MKLGAGAAALALVATVAFVLGRTTSEDRGPDAGRTPSNGDVTVAIGDELEAPSIALFCKSYVELGTNKLLCNRTGANPRWQVIFERDRTTIGEIGFPGDERIFTERR